jgi:hypothetical protein
MSNNQGLTTNHSGGLRPVKMTLSVDTIAKVKFIRDRLGCTSNTDALARGIRLVYSILVEMKDGTSIQFHRSNGDVEELVVK